MKNYQIKLILLSVIFYYLTISCSVKNSNNKNVEPNTNDSLWTYEDGAKYAIKNKDSTKWLISSLRDDLELKKETSKMHTQPAISDYPSLVSKYNGAIQLGKLELTVSYKKLKGSVLSYACDKYRPKSNPKVWSKNYLNILFLTDMPENKYTTAHATSRNYPHYMTSGKQRTSMGDIDWVHLQRADGENIAIVTQRYFDLKYGKTLIVIPHNDGSVRLLQLPY